LEMPGMTGPTQSKALWRFLPKGVHRFTAFRESTASLLRMLATSSKPGRHD